MRNSSRLRAVEYLAATIDQGGFAAAARELGVSTPAVHKLIASLEDALGVPLLHRTGRQLKLTREGETYLAGGREALAYLARAEREISSRRSSPAGRVRLAMSGVLGFHCVAPRLADFRRRYPELALDLIEITATNDLEALDADVLVCLGWTEQQDCIVRRIAQTRFLIVAAPHYWRERGHPRVPGDLCAHDCLALRLLHRAVLDSWSFEKDGLRETVVAEGWLVADDRDWIVETVAAGAGVARVPDIVARPWIERGLLEPALLDWELHEAPPVTLCYRRAARTQPRVRAVVDFLSTLFREVAMERVPALTRQPTPEPAPMWMRKRGRGPVSQQTRPSRPGR